ncbi:MAG: hypothetical protein H7249_14110 [Chitinophagaceae bacterium]|nr:hypothetical protein [Oligoflexus sp.]
MKSQSAALSYALVLTAATSVMACKNDTKMSAGVNLKNGSSVAAKGDDTPIDTSLPNDAPVAVAPSTVVAVSPAVAPASAPVSAPSPVAATFKPPPVAVPSTAVKKGNFTVWTVPADPVPFKHYMVYILVNIPLVATNYTDKDVTGSVIGSDTYVKDFGGLWPFDKFTTSPGYGLYQVDIPGSFRKVSDMIKVQSTLLNENQELKIVF